MEGKTTTTTHTTILRCANCCEPQTPNHKLIRCKCHRVWYCNSICQRSHWTTHRTEHRRMCAKKGLSRMKGERNDQVENGSTDNKETTTTPDSVLCSSCGSPETSEHELKACKGCHTTQYCNRECQMQHWEDGGHRTECKKERKKQQRQNSTNRKNLCKPNTE